MPAPVGAVPVRYGWCVFARGRRVAIVHRLYDDDDELVVVPPGSPVPDDAAIDAAVAFQETAGQYVFVRNRPAIAGRVPIGRADTG
jgi:hypothetical protein